MATVTGEDRLPRVEARVHGAAPAALERCCAILPVHVSQ